MIFLPLLPWLHLAELALSASLAAAQLPVAMYGALVPSRPRCVNGQRATEEYARENGLLEHRT